MNIRLWGYFDKNFGDDLMQLIVIRSMKEYRFFVDCAQREFLTHLYGEENVTVGGAECKADAVVNVIGTGFRYRSKMNILTKFLSLPSEDRTKYAKTAVIDCSVDAPKNAAERWLVRRELNKYGLISCRDEVSRELISEMTAKGEVCRHEDIVFALGDEYISKPTNEGFLGVIPVQRGFSGENFEYYKTLAAMCDRYAEKNNGGILIFALDTGNENDTLAALTVKRLMRRADKAEIIAYNAEPKYIFDNLARCEKVISSRFHGVIAAILTGIPIVAVSDTSKLDILSKRLGFESVKKIDIDEESLAAALERVDKPIAVPRGFRADAAEHLAELRRYLEN